MSAVVPFPERSAKADLERLEARIKVGLRGTFDAGAALKEIRDDERKLYRIRDDGAYQTFEAYCQGAWNLSKPRAYQLVDSYDTMIAITKTSTLVDVSEIVMTERLLRPLSALSAPADKVAAFTSAVQMASDEGRPVAGRHMAMAVLDMRTASTPKEFSDYVKPTDNWNINPVRYVRIDGEDGHGYIPGEIYVNCLWYYTKPGDVVVAPMAGGGQIQHIYNDRATWALAGQWELDIRMFDLNPRGKHADKITQHDLTNGFPAVRPDYIVMDVPYFGMVDGQYSKKTEDLANMNLNDWSAAIEKIAVGCASSQDEGSLCTAICPNYSNAKTGKRVLASRIVERAFEEAGYTLFDLAYAARHIQQNQTPGMGQLNNMAKRNRTMLTDMSIVMTFVR